MSHRWAADAQSAEGEATMNLIRRVWCVLAHRRYWSPLAVCRDCAKCGREFVDLKGMTILFHVEAPETPPADAPRET